MEDTYEVTITKNGEILQKRIFTEDVMIKDADLWHIIFNSLIDYFAPAMRSMYKYNPEMWKE